MRNTSYALVGLLLCVGASGCSDVETPDEGQQGTADARVVGGSGGGVGGAGGAGGAGGVGGTGGSGGTAGAGGVGGGELPDQGLPRDAEPVDMAEVEDDAAVPMDPVVLSVVLTEQPQAETASADVSVVAPSEIPNMPGCVVEFVDPDQAAPPPPASYDGGTVTVSGLVDGQLAFDLQGARYQPSAGIGDDLFRDGAAIHVSGAGGPAIGAFELDVTAPNEVDIRSPNNLETKRRADGLSVQWRAEGAQSILLTLFPVAPFSVDAVAGNWVFCGADDAGQFDVPAEVMQQLPAGGALVAVTRFAVQTAPVGESTAAVTLSTSSGVAINLN
jgi:hypothetical protein